MAKLLLVACIHIMSQSTKHITSLFTGRPLIVIQTNGGAKQFIEEFMCDDIYLRSYSSWFLVSIQRLPTTTSSSEPSALFDFFHTSAFPVSTGCYCDELMVKFVFSRMFAKWHTFHFCCIVHTCNSYKTSLNTALVGRVSAGWKPRHL